MITSLQEEIDKLKADGQSTELQITTLEDILTKLQSIEERLTRIEVDTSLKTSCVPYLPANISPDKKIVQITPGRYYIFRKPSDKEIDKLKSWKLL